MPHGYSSNNKSNSYYARSGHVRLAREDETRARLHLPGDDSGGGGGAEPTASPVYRSHSFTGLDSVTSIDVAYPAGLAANDILLLSVLYDPVGGTGVALNVPSGFTLIGTEQTINGRKTALLWGRATGTETGNLTVTLTGTMAASRVFSATLAAYSGCVTDSSPVDDYSETAANTGTPTMLPVTTAGPLRRVVSFFGQFDDNWPTAGPSAGWTERGRDTSAAGYDSAVIFHDIEQTAAGSPTDNSITGSVEDWGIHAVALIPTG